MASEDETLEQTLFVCRDNVKVFQIPPRTSDRVLSAEWRVDACCFTGRLRLLAKGDHAEIRLEDANTGDLFAVAPIPPGSRSQVVEPVADSSRNFVLRLEDAASGRHAFVGLGFAERPAAFDFNVALGDHDKHVRRAREIEEARRRGAGSSSSSSSAAPAAAAAAATAGVSKNDGFDGGGGGDDNVFDASSRNSAVLSALYGASARDLSLKEGETIKVAVVKSGGGGGGGAGAAAATADGGGGGFSGVGGGFLSRQQAAAAAAAPSGAGGGLFSLPPPPGAATGGLAPPPPPPSSDPFAAAPAPPPSTTPTNNNNGGGGSGSGGDQGWATFD